MLDYNPWDEMTPRARRAMNQRFVAWLLVGIAFAFVFALTVQAAPRNTGAQLDGWSYSVTPPRANLGVAAPVLPVERKSLPPAYDRKGLNDLITKQIEQNRERQIDQMLRDLAAERAHIIRELRERETQERHRRGIVRPDEL
jgi:hypothetical protein